MSNDEYQQIQFYQPKKMRVFKLPKLKVDFTGSPRPGVAWTFPCTQYVDMVITVLFLDINFKWTKR